MAYRQSITNLLLKLGRKIPKNCLIDNKSKSKKDIFYKQPMEALNSVHFIIEFSKDERGR